MKSNNGDGLFRDMAKLYTENEGAALRCEQRALEQSGVRYVTPRADASINTLIGRRKKRPTWIPLVAAAAAVILLVPLLLRGVGLKAPANDGATDISSLPQIMAISFVMPSNLTVESAEYDNGQSIYLLRDAYGDDVALVMEPDGALLDIADMRRIELYDREAYSKWTDAYALLTFTKDGVHYTLSCRHDLNTLLTLANAICAD